MYFHHMACTHATLHLVLFCALLRVHIVTAHVHAKNTLLRTANTWLTYGHALTNAQSVDHELQPWLETRINKRSLFSGRFMQALGDNSTQVLRGEGDKSTFVVTLINAPVYLDVIPAVNKVISIVESTWTSNVPVNTRIDFAQLGGSDVLANGGGTHFVRMLDVFDEIVPVAVAEAVRGIDLNAHEQNDGRFDAIVTVNLNAPWYVGVDGHTSADKYDLVTVLLHEIYHNLVFTGSVTVEVNKNRRAKGGIYQTAYIDNNLPTRFDAFLANREGCAVLDYLNDRKLARKLRKRPSEVFANAVVNDDLYFAHKSFGIVAKLYAPRVFLLHSSIYHIDSKDPDDRVMTATIQKGKSQHALGSRVLAIQNMFLDPNVKGANRNCPRPLLDPSPKRPVSASDIRSSRSQGTAVDKGGNQVVYNSKPSVAVIVTSVLASVAVFAISAFFVFRYVAAKRRHVKMHQKDSSWRGEPQ